MADSTQPGEQINADAIRKAKLAANRRRYYQKHKERIAAWKKSPAGRAVQKRCSDKAAADPEKRKKKRERDRIYSKRYRERHPERRREIQKRYRENNPLSVRQSYEKCVAANREKYQKSSREHSRKTRQRFRDKHGVAYSTMRANCDPMFRLVKGMRSRINMALKSANASKSRRTMSLVGCTLGELFRYVESKFLDGMSWQNRSDWHLDHIIPLSKFDLTDPDQQAAAFHYTNLQCLWAKENLTKSSRVQGQHLFGFGYAAKIADAATVSRKRRYKA